MLDYIYVYGECMENIPEIYSELFKKAGFSKEQNAGFSAQIYRVTPTKTYIFFSQRG